MKTYLITYDSKGNMTNGRLCVPAYNIAHANDKFYEWLKRQETYKTLWRLSYEIEEVPSV